MLESPNMPLSSLSTIPTCMSFKISILNHFTEAALKLPSPQEAAELETSYVSPPNKYSIPSHTSTVAKQQEYTVTPLITISRMHLVSNSMMPMVLNKQHFWLSSSVGLSTVRSNTNLKHSLGRLTWWP
jgi:hypothetical protein